METFYDILGVTNKFTTEEITAAYKQRCLEYHPDRQISHSPTQFQLLQKAYSVLIDPKERSKYDRYLLSGLDMEWDEFKNIPLVIHWSESEKEKQLTGKTDKGRDVKTAELREKFRSYQF